MGSSSPTIGVNGSIKSYYKEFFVEYVKDILYLFYSQGLCVTLYRQHAENAGAFSNRASRNVRHRVLFPEGLE